MTSTIERLFGPVKVLAEDDTACVRCGDVSSTYAVYMLDRGWLCSVCDAGLRDAIGAWTNGKRKRKRKTKPKAKPKAKVKGTLL